MFRSAATKIAHNSTLPALAINQDLRPLQDLITAEKTVILSLQRLATDLSKASEALKAWGLGEGDDLGDVLTASTTILTHFTSALSQYASHGHYMREQLKSIRTLEENLDELKRRRRNLGSKADAADKKLHRMSPEHKNFVPQTELLTKLRDEIKVLDVDIMKDEAAIADFKRSATRTWVGLKFGGLIECCEKGVIAGEYGKLIVSEIPHDQTQPGLPRSPYLAHSRIGDLVAEAHRCVNEVRLSTVPSTTQPLQQQQQLPQVPHVSDSPFMTQGPFSPSQYQPQPRYAEPYSDDPPRRNWEQLPPAPGRLDSPLDNPIHHSPQHHYSGSLSNAGLPSSLSGRHVDEFGNPIGPPDTGGARFATFPVKARSTSASGIEPSQFSLIATPPPDHAQSDSFSSSVAQALAATASHEPESIPLPAPGRFSKDGPAPSYEASVDRSSPPGGDANSPNTQQSQQQSGEGIEEHQEGGKHVHFGRIDAIPQQQSSLEEAAEPSGKAVGQGPQARLARLLHNEDEDQNKTHASNERSLDAAAAREVALELIAPAHDTGEQVPPTMVQASPPGSSSSSPVGATELERVPTYTEKPISYHNQYGTPPPVAPSTPPASHQQPYYHDSQQQQQPPLSSPAGHSYQQGGSQQDVYADERGHETEFYSPYSELQDAGAGGRNLSPSISSPPQLSLSFTTDVPPQTSQPLQQPSPQPSSLSIGGGGGGGGGGDTESGSKPRSPLYERGPNAPYMMKPSPNSSLNSLSTGGGGGGGKISAAAFKRPSPRIGSNSGSPFASPTVASPGAAVMVSSSPSVQPLRVGKRQQQQQQDLREGEGEYDYIGAYGDEKREGEGEGEGDVGAGVGTYYYNGLGGGGQGKFANK